MITSKHSYIGNRKCVKYSGAHKELRAMLNVGDIVTLLRQNGDKSESIKITGTVRWLGRNIVTVNVMGDERDYLIKTPNGKPPYLYEITSIKRPVENMLPDSQGLWEDSKGNIWVVDPTLAARIVWGCGAWTYLGLVALCPDYAPYAPFTKLTTILDATSKEEA